MITPPHSRLSPVQPSANTAGGDNTPRTLRQRLRAARDAYVGEVAEVVPTDTRGIAAWAHAEIAGSNFSRVADDDEGWRIAVQCGILGNPLLRPTPESRDELVRRIRKAWSELEPGEVQRVLAHVDARIQAVILAPSRRLDQAEHNKSRRSWVHGWQYDVHDAEASR